MKSARPKVLHRVAGTPMIEWVLATAGELSPLSTTLVVGHQADAVKAALARHPGVTFVVQEPQLGTGHAVLMAEPALRDAAGTLVLLSGDVPLLRAATLKTLLQQHEDSRAALTVVTATVDDPRGYGRIVRSGQRIARIVEEHDASSSEREIGEINAGIYALAMGKEVGLFEAIRGIATDNAQHEYYLPDLVRIYTRRALFVETMMVANPQEILGINSRNELAAVSRIVRQAKNAELMAAGVTIEDPATTYIDRDVQIGVDTVIHPGVSLEGGTIIGTACEIHSGVRIIDSQIGNGAIVLNHCVLNRATLADGASVGPFAHLRPGAALRAKAKVGNFVEIKETTIGEGSKAMHLSYLGDTTVGARVNIGAGTITCNYDGDRKHPTTIEDGAFIGSDSQLVAPVTVGRGAYVGTGTTIRANVPPGALAVSAGKQRNLEGWVDKKKKRK
jgi:bifunctional UDP-N-acetylglucosamine pyrophosphorylase/glucosamine-1-phosphate N-acetyltransferase